MSAQPHRTIAPHRGVKTSRVTRAAGIATAAALLTAGCAAGQVAQTAYQKASLDGTNVSIGSIDLRGVAIQAPPDQQPYYRPGTAAPLVVVFVNNGRSNDQLTGITTSAASGWAYFTDYNQAHQVEQAAGDAVTGAPTPSASESASASASSSESGSSTASGSSSASDSSSASGSPSASDSPSASASSSALPTGTKSITIPAGGRASVATPDTDAALLLTGISKALYPANTVNVTFTFAKAGSLTVAVPVQVATLGRPAEVTGGG